MVNSNTREPICRPDRLGAGECSLGIITMTRGVWMPWEKVKEISKVIMVRAKGRRVPGGDTEVKGERGARTATTVGSLGILPVNVLTPRVRAKEKGPLLLDPERASTSWIRKPSSLRPNLVVIIMGVGDTGTTGRGD